MASLPDIGSIDTNPGAPFQGLVEWVKNLPLVGDFAKLFVGGKADKQTAMNALLFFGLGPGQMIAQTLVGKRLSRIEGDTINVRRLLPAAVLATVSMGFVALLVPDDDGSAFGGVI